MGYPRFKPLKKENLKTISIKKRKSLVKKEDFGSPYLPGSDLGQFLKTLPNILAARDFKELIRLMLQARKFDRPIIWGIGGHFVKIGLSPVLIDLMERGWVSAIATNGAGVIHDFEIALCGQTSENVAEGLLRGTYGNTQETGLFINLALKDGFIKEMGAGEAIGKYLLEANFPYGEASILYQAYKMQIPVTVHVAIGTDVIHYHPMFVGEICGAMSERDFLLFSGIVAELKDGGIFLNIGSNVILPEVFLKAVAFCVNKGIKLEHFTTAVFDQKIHYRPYENVFKRPVKDSGRGFYFVGHNEIMIPLLAAALLSPSAW